jgi:hypothetical protein
LPAPVFDAHQVESGKRHHFQKGNLAPIIEKLVAKAVAVLQPDAIERFCSIELSDLQLSDWHGLRTRIQNFPEIDAESEATDFAVHLALPFGRTC